MTTRSTTSRGYGAAHQRERARLEPIVRAGGVKCFRCNEDIAADGPWDLGHNDDRTAWTGPEHVKCNRAAGGANGAAVTNQKKQTITRDW